MQKLQEMLIYQLFAHLQHLINFAVKRQIILQIFIKLMIKSFDCLNSRT